MFGRTTLAPLAVTPLAVTPLAVTPLAVTPLAVTPLAVTPLAVTPLAVSLLAVAMLMVTPLMAGEEQSVSKGELVTLAGTLVCLGCDLKKTEGARAECSAFGHTHALKTENGEYIHFLDNKFSADLVSGEKYHNKEIEIHGIRYANAQMIDVETFTVDGKKKGWCTGCKSMDGCALSSKGAY